MSEIVATKLKLFQGYKFKVEFDVENIPSLFVDEMKPIGDGFGPNPTRLLSVAVGHCLSSSLIYCLNKSKVKIKNLVTTVKANIVRNEEGRLRIKKIDVRIRLDVDEESKKRISRCLDIFEKYCTVTQSVRKGIEVNLNIE